MPTTEQVLHRMGGEVTTSSKSGGLDRSVAWEPNPGPQTRFIACNAREVLYGGAAGGGKSDGLLAFPLRYATSPHFKGIVFRRSFPEMNDLVDRSNDIFPALNGVFRSTKRRWYFPSGATFEFAYLEAMKDKYRYQGRQFTYIAWDELTQYATDEAYLYLISRCRTVLGPDGKPVIPLYIRATTNPGGVGHHWVRERWNIPDEGTGTEMIDEDTGYRRIFIPARVTDNPKLSGKEYEIFLRSLPEHDRRALLEGRWDVYEGQAFPEWSPFTHMTTDEEERRVLKSIHLWKKWRGGDDGYAAPHCTLWFAQDPDSGIIYVYDEIYVTKQTADVISELLHVHDGTFHLDGVLDNSAFADIGIDANAHEKNRAGQMNQRGARWEPATKGPGSRLNGKMLIHQLLRVQPESGQPLLKVFRRCTEFLRTFPALPFDVKNKEDVDTAAEDHAYDALRYGLQRVENTITMQRLLGL